jgi:hypothetical protein
VCSAAQAVVIYGSTDPNANTTAPTGTLANSGWQWTYTFDHFDVTAVAPNWVVVAEHVRGSFPSTNTIYGPTGTPYTIDNVNYVRIGTTDLTLLKVNAQLPSFAPISTNAVTADENKFMLDIGRGKDPGAPIVISSVLKGWGQGLTNSTQRWGTNNTYPSSALDSTLGNFLLSTFDASGGFNEMSLDIGDSSGPMFVQEGGTWKLAGVNYGAADIYSTSSNGANSFSANIFNFSGLYDQVTGPWAPATTGTISYYSHVGSNYNLISAATGVINWTGNSNASQTWSATTKWAGGVVPNGIDKTAIFTNSNTSGGAINVNIPVTLGALVFASGTTSTNAPLSYIVTGSSTLTFDVSTLSSATLRVDYGSHSISAPVATNQNLSFDINGTQLSLSNTFTTAAGKTLTKTGTGTLQMSGAWSNGIGAQFLASAGTTNITQDMGSNMSVTANSGGILSFTNSQHLGTLTVNTGGLINGPSANNAVLAVNGISMSGGKLDLGVNDLIVHATSGTKAAVYASVYSAVTSGFNGGAWNGGSGIESTSAAANSQRLTTLATVLNDDGTGTPFTTTFSGQSVGANDILVKYTWYGDANLDGIVNAADYALLSIGFNSQLTGWHNGDFNNDGVINAADFALIDNTYNFFGGGTLNIGDLTPLTLLGLTNVPEPSGLCVFLIGVGTVGIGRLRAVRLTARR